MNRMLDDVAPLGRSGAAADLSPGMPLLGRKPGLVCAECGHHGDPVPHRWGIPACACCGSMRLVSAGSPMAAGHWQSRPRQRPSKS